MRMYGTAKTLLFVSLLLTVAALLTGCPSATHEKAGDVTITLVSSSPEAELSILGVGPESAAQVLVDVEAVYLLRVGPAQTERVPIFSGPQTVDLLALPHLAEVLAAAAVGEGDYLGIQVVISEARVEANGVSRSLALGSGGVFDAPLRFRVVPETDLALALDLLDMGLQRSLYGEPSLDPTFGFRVEPAAPLVLTEGRVCVLEKDQGLFVVQTQNGDFLIDYAESWGHNRAQASNDIEAAFRRDMPVSVVGRISTSGYLLADVVVPDDTTDAGKRRAGKEKVILCHVPHGNPANAHPIEVPLSAVPAHLAHGDYLGPCEDAGEGEGEGVAEGEGEGVAEGEGEGEGEGVNEGEGEGVSEGEGEGVAEGEGEGVAEGEGEGEGVSEGEGEGVAEGEGEIPVPDVLLSTGILDFAQQDIDAGATNTQVVHIWNVGETDLQILGRRLDGPHAAEFRVALDTGRTVIAPGYRRTIALVFDPASVGPKDACLRVTCDDADKPEVEVRLTGVGVTVSR